MKDWSETLDRINTIVATDPHLGLAWGEEFIGSMDPFIQKEFKWRRAIHNYLETLRKDHKINVENHIDWVRQIGFSKLDEAHILRELAAREEEFHEASTAHRKASRLTAMAKVLFRIGYIDEAEKKYLQAHELDPATTYPLNGLAALYRYRMFQEPPKSKYRREAWRKSADCVDEALEIDSNDRVALNLLESLRGDKYYLEH